MINSQRNCEIGPAVGKSLWWEGFVDKVSLEPKMKE